MNPLSLSDLKPVPLPRDLDVLANGVVAELAQAARQLIGYVKSLGRYGAHREAVVSEIDAQLAKLQDVVSILAQYKSVSGEIDELLVALNKTHHEFVSAETIQYQLLSANFNQELLKRKYIKLIHDSERQAQEKAKGSHSTSLDETLLDFRLSRKQHHLRSEKLNRWNEERVTGFV